MTMWTTGKIRRLQEMYRSMSNPQIAIELGSTARSVQSMAKRIGLRKVGPDPSASRESAVIKGLRDRVEELESALGIDIKLPNEFGLSVIEMQFLGVLIRRDIVNRDTLFSVIYGGRPECEQPDRKTVEVHICNIRRKILPKGYAIHTMYNAGYYMDQDARAALREIAA